MLIINKLQGMEELRARLKDTPRRIELAMASGLNKIGSQANTQAKRAITGVYNIKSGDVSKAMERIPAKAQYGKRAGRMFTVIKVNKGGRIPLFMFGGRPRNPPGQKGIAVSKRTLATVQILKGSSRRTVTVDKETGNLGFVARMPKSGHTGIFVRTGKWNSNPNRFVKPGKEHESIRELKSGGIGTMFEKAGVKAMDRLVAEKGHDIMQHEVNYYLTVKSPPPASTG